MPLSEREKMLAGELYVASDPELVAMRRSARQLTHEYNQSSPDDPAKRVEILKKLFGSLEGPFEIEPPFRCDYGSNIYAQSGVFMNFGCVILDCAEVHLGKNVMMAPNVHLYAAHHPLKAEERIKGPELASSIRIGDNVWLGGGVIVCPGVTIGANTTIGAGSVVTKDIPANVLAVGNPCRVVRVIE